MISLNILQELKTVWTAVLSGAFITLVYDVLRIFRRLVSHGNWWIGLEDFCFWIWTSFWSFSLLYRENDGSFRLYTIGAMILGMILYHQTVSDPLVTVVSKILKKVIGIMLFPVKKLKIYIIFWENKLKNIFLELIIKLKDHNR